MKMWILAALLALVSAGGAAAQEPEAYYTDAQAVRGQALFDKHCGSCHFAEPDPQKAKGNTTGFMLAKQKLPSNLAAWQGGTYVGNRRDNGRRLFPSVYYLFRELESMPAQVDSITSVQRTDILAYLLRQNGYPSGRSELKFDLAAMKLMPLDEPGFLRLFNGRDFAGWKFLIGLGCAPPPDGCGRTDAGKAFTIHNGELLGSGKEHGYMYTTRTFKNFTLRLEQLSAKPADFDGEDFYWYANTGFHLFLQDENHFVWPKSITLIGEQRDLLRPVALGSKIKSFTEDNDLRARVLRPMGQWNSIEIQSRDGNLKGYINDTLVVTVTQHEFTTPGHIGIQMQGFAGSKWRNIRIRED
jgi:mono/diheme cytochrome c family protein